MLMATTPFPHRYSVTLIADELTEGPRERIRAGAPPQFGGVEDVWSPEHLLIAAALTCLKTTFPMTMGDLIDPRSRSRPPTPRALASEPPARHRGCRMPVTQARQASSGFQWR